MLKGLRTIRIISSALLSSKSTVSQLDYRVGLADCDFNRHLTNSKYPAYMDLGRWDIMVRTGALAVCLKHRIAPVVVDMNLEFKRELRFQNPIYPGYPHHRCWTPGHYVRATLSCRQPHSFSRGCQIRRTSTRQGRRRDAFFVVRRRPIFSRLSHQLTFD